MARVERLTPLGALAAGIGAGIAGTVILSLLSRVIPGMHFGRPIPPPENNPEASAAEGEYATGLVTRATPAQALTEPQAPGPEGLAQQFAFKAAAGLFGVDISRSARMWGLAVHFLYGSAWGALLGLILGTYGWTAAIAGPIFGFLVWLVGPGVLVPAMRILPPLLRQGSVRLGVLVAAHLLWGLIVAYSFRFLERRFS